MGRRLQYREAAENIVRGMIDQLSAMTDGSCSALPLQFRPSELYFYRFTVPSRRIPRKSRQKNANYAPRSMQSKGQTSQRTYVSALRTCLPGGTLSPSRNTPLRESRAGTKRIIVNSCRPSIAICWPRCASQKFHWIYPDLRSRRLGTA